LVAIIFMKKKTLLILILCSLNFRAQAETFYSSSLSTFFFSIPACEAKEIDSFFTEFEELGSYTYTVDSMSRLAREVTLPLKTNEFYFGWARRPKLKENFLKVVELIKNNDQESIEAANIKRWARARYIGAKSSGEIGECFPIFTMGGIKYAFGTRVDWVSIDSQTMSEIALYFENISESELILSLSINELIALEAGLIELDAISTLRGIRKATEIFEQNTFLINDKAGGFWSNLSGEFSGNQQQNCTTETYTLLAFLDVLKLNNLIDQEYSYSMITQRPDFFRDPSQSGHVAVELNHPDLSATLVLDSWFEKGGSAAHIITKEDWLSLSLVQANVFNNLVSLP